VAAPSAGHLTRQPSLPELSICIPTHHGRAAQLGEALDSVLGQLAGLRSDRVEVCVSDNGSRDDTREVVAARQQTHPGVISYRRFDDDQGFAVNLLAE